MIVVAVVKHLEDFESGLVEQLGSARRCESWLYAPIWSTRVLIGVGPRIADHTINLVPLSIWPSYEDMTLKNKNY